MRGLALQTSAVFVIGRSRTRNIEWLETRCRQATVSRGLRPVFFEHPDGSATPAERVRALAGCIAECEPEVVVAVGGDGTVRLCAEAIGEGEVALATVPRGAANLVAHTLGLPFRLEAALDAGLDGGERLIDVAVVNGQLSLAMAGMGADAAVVRSTPSSLKRNLGWIGYAVVALPHLHAAPHDFEIRLDGGEPIRRRAHAVVIGNVGILPGGFTLLPGAKIDDGVLDVGVVAPEGILGWAELGAVLVVEQLVWRASTGVRTQASRHVLGGSLEHLRGREIEVHTAAELAYEIDGELIGTTNFLSASVRSKPLRVRVPRRRSSRRPG
jgi:diacylglycerol kinase family enzyme